MSGIITSEQRELLFRREDVFKAWLDQISKDLGEDLFEKRERLSWPVVVELIQNHLLSTYRLMSGEIPELLYRIDLNEGELRAEMQTGNWPDWYQLLANCIAEREAQKVIFRFQYSGKL
ncbi:MAG: hypothetical protein HWE14_07290 [Flavobacteriia bacterium]|nr:hypothetical protein [Flavobacteriia bacterium]